MEKINEVGRAVAPYFGSLHRKKKKGYKVTLNPKLREKTLSALMKIKTFCVSELNRGKIGKATQRNYTKVVDIVNYAFLYLKKAGKSSNIRLARFYPCLSKRQIDAINKKHLVTVADLTLLTKQEIVELLRFKFGNPDPSFLVLVGKRE